jgi:hypothetical protein
MPKIRITTDRRPWLNGAPLEAGAELDVDATAAEIMVGLQFAELVDAPKPARRRKDDDA